MRLNCYNRVSRLTLNFHKQWQNVWHFFEAWFTSLRRREVDHKVYCITVFTLYIGAPKAFQTVWHFWRNCFLLFRSFALSFVKSCTSRGSRCGMKTQTKNKRWDIRPTRWTWFSCLIVKKQSTIRAAFAIHWNLACSDKWNMTPGLLVA